MSFPVTDPVLFPPDLGQERTARDTELERPDVKGSPEGSGPSVSTSSVCILEPHPHPPLETFVETVRGDLVQGGRLRGLKPTSTSDCHILLSVWNPINEVVHVSGRSGDWTVVGTLHPSHPK